MDGWDSEKMLAMYVYDYMKKRKLSEAAETFAAEANLDLNEQLVDSPEGFLAEWWSVFWPIYQSRPSRASERNTTPTGKEPTMENPLLLATSGTSGAGSSAAATGMTQPWPGFPNFTGPDNKLGQPSATVLPAFGLGHFDGNMMGQQGGTSSLLPTLGETQHRAGKRPMDAAFGDMVSQPVAHMLGLPPLNVGSSPGLTIGARPRARSGSSNTRNPQLHVPRPFPQPGAMDNNRHGGIVLGRSTPIPTLPAAAAGQNPLYAAAAALYDADTGKRIGQMPPGQLSLELLHDFAPVSSGMENHLPDSILRPNQQLQIFPANQEIEKLLQMSTTTKETARNQGKPPKSPAMRTSSNALAGNTSLGGTNPGGDDYVESFLFGDYGTAAELNNLCSTLKQSPASGLDNRNIQIPLTEPREGPLTGADPVSAGTECHLPNSVLQSNQQEDVHTLAANEQMDNISQLSGPTTEIAKDKGKAPMMIPKNTERGTSSNSLAGMTPMGGTGIDVDTPAFEDVDAFFSDDYGSPAEKRNSFCTQQQSSSSNTNEILDLSFQEAGNFRIIQTKLLCCHFSSDGRFLAYAGHEGKVIVYDEGSHDFFGRGEGHTHIVTDVRFRPNSAIFATSSFDRSVKIWDATRPSKSLMRLTGHSEPVMSVDFHPRKPNVLCSCDSTGEIRLWNLDQNTCMLKFKGANRQVRFQPDGNILAAAMGHAVNLFDADTTTIFFKMEGHAKDIRSICWDNSGNHIASVGEDGARIWSTFLGGKCIHELPSIGNKYESCIFHPNFPLLLVIGCYQTIEIWNPSVSDRTVTVNAHEGMISGLAISSGLKKLASVSHDNWMKFWK